MGGGGGGGEDNSFFKFKYFKNYLKYKKYKNTSIHSYFFQFEGGNVEQNNLIFFLQKNDFCKVSRVGL